MECVIEVPYIKQDTPTTCWNASYKMMLKYKKRGEELADKLPNDAQMRDRGILDAELFQCRCALGLSAVSADGIATPEKLKKFLENYGPIWTIGYWATDFSTKDKPGFKHAVVIRGVRDGWFSSPEVYVNDPYRGYKAAPKPSWWSWSHFWDKMHRVPYSCQFWF